MSEPFVGRPRIPLCANSNVRNVYWSGEALARPDEVANWECPPSDAPADGEPPRIPATCGMLGERETKLLEHEADLVNVSRGAIVKIDALIARAKSGVSPVCLDVFHPEPVPASGDIRDLPNVFLSPHIAGVTAACWPRFFSFMVDEFGRSVAGHGAMFDLSPGVMANRRGAEPAAA